MSILKTGSSTDTVNKTGDAIAGFFANIPIFMKVLFVAIVPLGMLSWLMIGDVRQALREEASMQTMLQAAGLSESVNAMVDELQKERGMSAGFLGGRGKKFSSSLDTQNRRVDQVFSNFAEALRLNRPLIQIHSALSDVIHHFRSDIARIGGIRQGVRELKITLSDELTYYTNMVNDLMRITNHIRMMYTFGAGLDKPQAGKLRVVPDARFSGLLTSFLLLGRATEAAGIERAVLSNAFGQNHFGPGMYERFVSLVSRQRYTLYQFSMQSPPRIEKIFSSIYHGKAITQVERLRDIAMKSAKNGGFDIAPEQWFRLSSERIELLHQAELKIVELIREHGRQGVEQAAAKVKTILFREFLAILIAVGLSFGAVWLLLSGIRRAGQAVHSIESGDYSIPIGSTGRDELGRMLSGIERMRLVLWHTERARAEQQEKARARLVALQHARDELRRGHLLIQRLLEAMPSLLIGVDADGNINQWNAAAENTFGVTAGKSLRRPFMESIGQLQDVIGSAVEQIRCCNTVYLEQVDYQRPDGVKGVLKLTFTALFEGGNYAGFLLLGEDISEQIRMEQQRRLGQKMEAIGELAAGIAHEINTPMQYIGDNIRFLKDGFTDILKLIACYDGAMRAISQGRLTLEEGLSDIRQCEEDADIGFLRDEAPQAIAQTLEGVAHVSKIVGAMKELSHPGTEEKVLIDINKGIDNTVTVCRNEWKYVADLEMELDPDLPMIHVLPEVNQVFLNIIVNAAQAIAENPPKNSGDKGHIHISTCCANDMIEIRIRDSGPGIPRDQQVKIFNPFFTTKDPGKGTGQGLAISHHIICNRLNGRIFVESEPGQGAIFIIQLPVGEEGIERREERATESMNQGVKTIGDA